MSLFMAIIAVIGFFYLLSRINGLEGKIKKLEKQSGIPNSIPVVPSPSVSPIVTQSAVAEKVADHGAQAYSTPVYIGGAASVAPSAAPLANSAPIQKTDLFPPKRANSEFEFGAKTFTAVGVLALLAGIGFFLRYAFQNNLISESARVMLGVLIGFILCGIGIYLRRKFVSYGESLFGAGLGVLYVSAYAAYSFYHLIGSAEAFFFLFIISAIGVTMSLIYDSLPLVSFSLLGAYIITLLYLFLMRSILSSSMF